MNQQSFTFHTTRPPGQRFVDEYNEQARARSTDPGTSHAAAESVTAEKISASQQRVLYWLKRSSDSGLTQSDMTDFARQLEFSDSRIRTAVKELVRKGLVQDSGRRATLPSGRRAIVWQVTGDQP